MTKPWRKSLISALFLLLRNVSFVNKFSNYWELNLKNLMFFLSILSFVNKFLQNWHFITKEKVLKLKISIQTWFLQFDIHFKLSWTHSVSSAIYWKTYSCWKRSIIGGQKCYSFSHFFSLSRTSKCMCLLAFFQELKVDICFLKVLAFYNC